MKLLRNTLLLWVVMGLLVSNGLAAADRTPPPPGPNSHRAPPASPPKHKAPPAHPPKHKAPPAHPPKHNPPGPKTPPGNPNPPGGLGKPWSGHNPDPHPPGHPGKPWWGHHPDPHAPGHPGKPWWSHHPDPHHPDPHHPDPHHPDPHHPAPHHPDPHDPDLHDPGLHDPDLHDPWNHCPPEPPPHDDPHWQGHQPPELLNESGHTIRCRINGGLVSLSPGRVLPLEPDRPSIVEFHRGGEFGVARYELTHGVHKFVRTERGWELVRAEHEPPGFPPHHGLPENP